MSIRYDSLRRDLEFVFDWFPLKSLYYLRDNHHRLVRGKYTDGNGNGCMFWLLTRLLPVEDQINNKQDLTRFFTGSSGAAACELDDYQPARWLVRLVDGQVCANTRGRYGDATHVDWNYMLAVLDDVIREREQAEPEEALIERKLRPRKISNEQALAG